MPEYTPAPEAEKIGHRLIQKHHDELDGVRVEFVFRDKAAKTNGKTVYGKARKVGGLNAFLARPGETVDSAPGEDFFVVELARDVWTVLSKDQRVALIDHELCHLGTEADEKSGDLKLVLRPHDLEEFRVVLERHGLWDTDLEHFAKTLSELEKTGQLTLDEAGEPGGTEQ